MSALFDPWRDASHIAGLLAAEDSIMVVVIGAEQWCERCRTFKRVFERRAQAASGSEVWLWLDIEEHVDFVGDYFPDSLPVIIMYRGSQIVLLETVGDESSIFSTLETARSAPPNDDIAEPGIRTRLLIADWA